MVTYTLKIEDIIKETEDAVTLCFKQPSLRKIKYRAGQYLTLIFRINGRRYLRPYSFSSAPSADSNLQVTIKRVPNGIVSNHIHDRVKVGDAIEVMQPMGDFVFPENPDINAIFFWAVGSGITPVISLIKEILMSRSSIKLTLVYGNRNADTTIFSKVIDDLSKLYPNQFRVWHFHSKVNIRQADSFIIEGRITKSYILNILEDVDATNTMHYICGPAGLKSSVKEVLDGLYISKENIVSEDFELIRDPKDFIDVHTQNVRLQFQNAEHILEVIKGKSILESALDAGYELPYSCQTGNCNTCKASLIAGTAKMIGLHEDRKDIAMDEYLLCCTHPLSENVYFKV